MTSSEPQKLSAIYEHVPGILFCVAVESAGEFRFVSMSHMGLVAMGLTQEQVIGAVVRDVIPPHSRDLVLNKYNEAIRTRQTARWEEVSEYPAGRRYGEVAVTPVCDSDGLVTHLIGTVHDVTERKRLEHELRRREERLAFMLNLNDALRPLSDPVEMQEVTLRMVGEHLGVNRVAYSLVEGDRFVVISSYEDGVAPLRGSWSVDAFGAGLRDAYTRGETVTVTDVRTDARFSDDERQTLLAHGIVAFIRAPLRKEGRWVATFGVNSVTARRWTVDEVALVDETAERMWSAAERARAETILRQRHDEERDRELRMLMETAAQGIVMVDGGGRIVTVNRALETMFGWAPGELIGQSIDRLLPPSARRAHGQHRARYMNAPYPRLMGGELDTLVGQRKDTSTFPIEVSLNHIATDDGGRVIAFVTDITERRRAAAALQERTVELEQRNIQLSRLASDLTLAEHHAREQLAKTVHDGLQQLLLVAAFNIDGAMERGNRPGIGPAHLLTQAKSNLDDAIAAARSLSIELCPPALYSSGLPAALAWLADWARDKYRLDVEVSTDPLADTDRKDVRTLLFESVRELLVNAVKHAKVDRVSVDLALETPGRLCITVADAGIGFDPAMLAVRASTGQLGWGLFSVRERLTLLGGLVDIASTPGRGTRVRLIAPKDAPRVQANGDTAGAQPRAEAGQRPGSTLKILLVDDHAAVRNVFSEVLAEHPHLEVIGHAANGLEAIDQAQALRPDVILMDVWMPTMDGIEATRRIHAELPYIEILGLSMQPRTAGLHPIERAGAAAYFVKGIDGPRLIEHLSALHGARVIGTLLPG